MQHHVARTDPAQTGQDSVRLHSDLPINGGKELNRGQHALFTNQAMDLTPQRHKGDQMDDAQPTKIRLASQLSVYQNQPFADT
jgi:hypothetical protein